MTSKKKLIEGYFEKNKSIKRAHNQEASKYSHNRVFDEPESLKKLTIDHKKNSNKKVTNGKQIDNKWITKPITEQITNSPSSSSNKLIKETTTTGTLPENWLTIEFNTLKKISFSESHLVQLFKHGIDDPELVQQSIDHFSFDITHNNKLVEIKLSPLAYFMGIMKRVGAYTAPENYESPRDRALRQLVEDKKRQAEKRKSMEDELMMLAKNDWLENLSATERKHILEKTRVAGDVTPEPVRLSLYFKANIWPDKKQSYLTDV